MEFLYGLKNRLLENYILIIITIFLILINDLLILKLYGTNTQSKNVSNNEIISKENLKKDVELTETIKVDLKGYVKKPGVYEVEKGSNINDLISIAGGIKKGGTTDNINLSRKLKDEMVVIVSKKIKENNVVKTNNQISSENSESLINNDAKLKSDETIGISDSLDSNNPTIVETSFININTASKEELLMLSGIGESKANSIIEYRANNRFDSIDDIKKVPGIGESLFEKFKNKITV